MPGTNSELADEDVADAVHPLLELAVGERLDWADEADHAPPALVDPAVEKSRAAIEPLRILQLRPREQEVGPLILRGQIVPGEGVDMRRIRHGHSRIHSAARGMFAACALFNNSRAMTIFCTSVAPS